MANRNSFKNIRGEAIIAQKKKTRNHKAAAITIGICVVIALVIIAALLYNANKENAEIEAAASRIAEPFVVTDFLAAVYGDELGMQWNSPAIKISESDLGLFEETREVSFEIEGAIQTIEMEAGTSLVYGDEAKEKYAGYQTSFVGGDKGGEAPLGQNTEAETEL